MIYKNKVSKYINWFYIDSTIEFCSLSEDITMSLPRALQDWLLWIILNIQLVILNSLTKYIKQLFRNKRNDNVNGKIIEGGSILGIFSKTVILKSVILGEWRMGLIVSEIIFIFI